MGINKFVVETGLFSVTVDGTDWTESTKGQLERYAVERLIANEIGKCRKAMKAAGKPFDVEVVQTIVCGYVRRLEDNRIQLIPKMSKYEKVFNVVWCLPEPEKQRLLRALIDGGVEL